MYLVSVCVASVFCYSICVRLFSSNVIAVPEPIAAVRHEWALDVQPWGNDVMFSSRWSIYIINMYYDSVCIAILPSDHLFSDVYAFCAIELAASLQPTAKLKNRLRDAEVED